MVGMLAPEFEEVVTGEAEVREVFRVPKAGHRRLPTCARAQITRNSKVRFLRDGVIIWKGEINSLRGSRTTCVKSARASSAASACPTSRI
jgi:translation initiation factor IF-2